LAAPTRTRSISVASSFGRDLAVLYNRRMGRPVIVVEHDPAWVDQFAQLRDVIAKRLGKLTLRVEHVGSTSVPGLAAKPILDINVVIESQADLPAVTERLATLGYYHEGDLGVAGREAFGPGDGTCPIVTGSRRWPRHHLYVCARDNPEHLRHMAFRDWLRGHEADAKRYGDLKRELARMHPNDVNAYTDGKKEFVENILARAERESRVQEEG
jgi:GrpB-like predicted nucleotidyltransferase (UPF0157 family)